MLFNLVTKSLFYMFLFQVPSNSTSDFEIITNEERRDGNSKSLLSLPNSNSKKIRNNGYFESHLSSLTSNYYF